MHMEKQHMSGQMKIKQAIYDEAVDYYRQRPDEYCEDIIGIKLNVYQKVMLRCIMRYDYIMFIMCRPWAWKNIFVDVGISYLCFTLSKQQNRDNCS